MSEALFERAAPGHEARSAGTQPAAGVHPEVAQVMLEVGIDLRGRVPQGLTPELSRWAEVVVTMGCGDECPVLPGRLRLDWDLPDPQGRPLDEVRATRDEIGRLVRDLAASLGKGRPPGRPGD